MPPLRGANSRADVPLLSPRGRIGIVGAGAFGRFCIDAYRESDDVDIVAVADPDSRARALVNAPAARVEERWEVIVRDPAIEVIHVATPPFQRHDVVMAALHAGKSVFCEKPIALTLPEADSMINAAKEARVGIGVNYVMRHHPGYRLLYQLAASGLFGATRTFAFENYAQAVPSGHWFWDRELSGGIFVEHGVHFFDAFEPLVGEPLRVGSRALSDEAVEATVRYRDGAIGRFYHEFAFSRDVEYAGSTVMFAQGTVRLEGWIPTEISGVVSAPVDDVLRVLGGIARHQVESEGKRTRFRASFGNRQDAYSAAIVAGLRDVVHYHRIPGWRMVVQPEQARASLRLALEARHLGNTNASALHALREPSAADEEYS